MHQQDIQAVADIHTKAFSRQQQSTLWIRCNFAAYPRIFLFVARNEQDQVVGYIQWSQKSGFRKEVVMELEQIAVLKNFQRSGIGTQLIKQSIMQIKDFLSDTNSKLKAVMVTTRTDNGSEDIFGEKLHSLMHS